MPGQQRPQPHPQSVHADDGSARDARQADSSLGPSCELDGDRRASGQKYIMYITRPAHAPLVLAAVVQCLHQEGARARRGMNPGTRSEEHTSELQSLMRTSYAVFCL